MSTYPNRPIGPTTGSRRSSPTDRDTIDAMLWIPASCKQSWGGNHRSMEHFEGGLRRTLVWYLENRTWCQRVMDGRYQGERLGSLS